MPHSIDLATVAAAFESLNIAATTNKKEIKKAAIQLLRVHHPDKSNLVDKSNTSEAHIHSAEINNARELLLETLTPKELESFVNEMNAKQTEYNTAPQDIAPTVAPKMSVNSKISNPVKLPIFIGIHKAVLEQSEFESNSAFFKQNFLKSKTLLVGQAESGKTTFFEKAFEHTPFIPSTIGADFKTYSCENLRHLIFNMANQVRFKSIDDRIVKESNLVFFFDNDAGILFKWLNHYKTHQNEFMLMTVSCVNNEITLVPYDMAIDALRLGDIDTNIKFNELVLKGALPQNPEASLDRLKSIVHTLYLQLNPILIAHSQIEMSKITVITLPLNPAPEANGACTIS